SMAMSIFNNCATFYCLFFFFSSRRRHTRFSRDWSSDVCSSDLYRWKRMAEQNYDWWRRRLEAVLSQVDIVRIDHFRGFDAYWEIPASEETAVKGRWVRGPGAAFFEAMQAQLGELPIIAEDLGVITPEVVALREQFDFPGMKILQFSFG